MVHTQIAWRALMSNKQLFAFCLALVVAAGGQTSDKLSVKYPLVQAYEVRPGILMTPKYAEDGQVCEMIVEKRHQTATTTDLGSTIPRDLVKELIDELVPPTERGRPTKRYLRGDSESTIAGGVENTDSDFENVAIRIVGSASLSCGAGDEVVIIQWKKRICAGRVPHSSGG